MKVIYIAGPYRDPRGEYYVRENIRRAEEAALCVWEYGGVAICPHMNTAFWGGRLKDEVFLEGDLELLKRCDAIYLVDGWVRSSGARREMDYAFALGKTVLYGAMHRTIETYLVCGVAYPVAIKELRYMAGIDKEA